MVPQVAAAAVAALVVTRREQAVAAVEFESRETLRGARTLLRHAVPDARRDFARLGAARPQSAPAATAAGNEP